MIFNMKNETIDLADGQKVYEVISLFCGAGGLDMGFERKGFHTVWGADYDRDACETYLSWNDTVIVCRDIANVRLASIPCADAKVMLGGFPCQGFSLAGPRKIEDSRNKLYRQYIRVLKHVEPCAFVGENVKGLMTMGSGAVLDAIIQDFSDCGYDVFYELVNAHDFGVPQDRERLIITGFRKDLHVTDFHVGNPEIHVTLGEALKNIPAPMPSEVCDAPYSSRFMSRNRKRGWDEYSYTIPAMAKQVPLHPSSPDMIKLDKDLWKFGNGRTRRFSYKEAAVIQTFPENMLFHGDLTSIYRQIGNAVPVKLAEYVAGRVREVLESKGV